MTRRLLNLLTALSLVLCIASATLWVRSYRVWDLIHVRTDWRWFHVSAAAGRLKAGTWLTAEHDPADGLAPRSHQAREVSEARDLLDHYRTTATYRLHALGFEYMALGGAEAAVAPDGDSAAVVPGRRRGRGAGVVGVPPPPRASPLRRRPLPPLRL